MPGQACVVDTVTVELDITHTWTEDLEISLEDFLLVDNICSSYEDLMLTVTGMPSSYNLQKYTSNILYNIQILVVCLVMIVQVCVCKPINIIPFLFYKFYMFSYWRYRNYTASEFFNTSFRWYVFRIRNNMEFVN